MNKEELKQKIAELEEFLKEAYPFIELVSAHFGSNRAMRLAVEIENLGLDEYEGAFMDWKGCLGEKRRTK